MEIIPSDIFISVWFKMAAAFKELAAHFAISCFSILSEGNNKKKKKTCQ